MSARNNPLSLYERTRCVSPFGTVVGVTQFHSYGEQASSRRQPVNPAREGALPRAGQTHAPRPFTRSPHDTFKAGYSSINRARSLFTITYTFCAIQKTNHLHIRDTFTTPLRCLLYRGSFNVAFTPSFINFILCAVSQSFSQVTSQWFHL